MVKKPVALQMKFLLVFAVLVLIFSIAVLPSVLKAAIAYERGCRAQQDGRHSTAIKEYEKVLEEYPDFASGKARLAISYFYNERISECSELLDRIAGRSLSGKLSRRVNEIIEKLNTIYFESNELRTALGLYGQEELEKTAEKIEKYLETNEDDVMGIFQLANICFDIGRYDEAEKLYIRAVKLQPGFYSANLNLAALYRIKGMYEKAEDCCNKVLASNKEHPQAFTALSKIELEKGDYQAGLEYAKEAYGYDSGDLHIISNLSMAYHLNGMTDERDALLEVLKHNNYHDMEALQSVFVNMPEAR